MYRRVGIKSVLFPEGKAEGVLEATAGGIVHSTERTACKVTIQFCPVEHDLMQEWIVKAYKLKGVCRLVEVFYEQRRQKDREMSNIEL
jgi:hypothetical protein